MFVCFHHWTFWAQDLNKNIKNVSRCPVANRLAILLYAAAFRLCANSMWTSVGVWWHAPFWRVFCWSVTAQKFPDLMNHSHKRTKEVTWCGCECSVFNNISHELGQQQGLSCSFLFSNFLGNQRRYQSGLQTLFQSGLQTLLSRFWNSGWLNINPWNKHLNGSKYKYEAAKSLSGTLWGSPCF